MEPLQPGQLLITVMNALRRRDLEISDAVHTRNLWKQFQTLIDMAPIPIYAKDSSHRYVVANAKAEEMAGFGRGELIGETDEAFAMSVEEAVALIEEGRDTQFDPCIVDLLLGHVDEAISIRA